MRILHVIENLDFSTGGPPVVASRLAAAQASLGSEVGLAFYGQGDDTKSSTSLQNVPFFDRVRLCPLDLEKDRTSLFGAVPPRLLELITNVDVVHLHGLWAPLLLAASRGARKLGKQYFITPHGMLDPWSLSQKRWKKKVAMALGYRAMIDHASALHVLNDDEKILLQPLGLKANLVTIPNGVFFEEIDPLPPHGAFYASRPQLRNRPYVLFLSRLHYKKGLDYLAAAFAELASEFPELDLVVAGPDGGAAMEFLETMTKHKLTDRAHVVGSIYGRDKFAAMVDAACFCLPSRQEGFSVAILEALATATPVVVSDACHFPEVAEAGAGFVVPLDAKQVAAAMRKIVTNPQARETLGSAGRQLVQQRFTWQEIARQTLQMYGQPR